MKTVAILGASYGGNRAAQILAQELPEDWRIVLVDRNSHFNHLYVLPRFAVLPEHGYKAFIPYTNIFGVPASSSEEKSRHVFVQAQVVALDTKCATLSRSFPEHGIHDRTLHFDYLVYALGSHLPAPINIWGPVDTEEEKDAQKMHDGSKESSLAWLEKSRAMVERTSSVLVVGGGALGIQYASDIAEIFPHKRVTLLHSRKQLLPKFMGNMHEEIMASLCELNVKVVLGERLDLTAPPKTVETAHGTQERVARTESGKELRAGIVLLCTGQNPNTAFIQAAIPGSVIAEGPAKGMVRVCRSMQVAISRPPSAVAEHGSVEKLSDELARTSVSDEPRRTELPNEVEVPHPNFFAVGDAADAFGAIKAGHTAYYQAEVAARNIVKLIAHGTQSDAPPPELEQYTPGEPAIKVSLGLSQSLYQVQGVVGRKGNVPEDLDAPVMWKCYSLEPTEELMRT